MSERGLKIGLAVSLGLNLFLVGAGASAVLFGAHYLHEHPFARQGGQGPSPLQTAARELPTESRQKVFSTIRAAAQTAAPDFRLARDSRRTAADLAAAPTFDRATVMTNLTQARDAETRGRNKLETALLDVMQTLPADQRARLAPVLKGRPRNARGSAHPHDPATAQPAATPVPAAVAKPQG